MTTGAPNGAPAPTTAAPSPAPSAPAASPAPASNGTRLPPGGALSGAPHPPSGAQQQAAAEAEAPLSKRFPWKTKIGEQEHEIDLAEYRHRVKIDGQDYELGLDELAKNQERLRSSMKRYDEASRLKKDAEAAVAKIEQEKRSIVAQLKDPAQALGLLRRALGVDRFNDAVIGEYRRLKAYAEMPDEERAVYDRHSQREDQLQRQRYDLERREQAIKAAEDARMQRLETERARALIAEWVPALERAGLPVKVNGQINERFTRMLAVEIKKARDNKVPMTLEEAVNLVREDYENMVGYEVQRRQAAAVAQLEAQPGRADPDPRTAPAPPRRREQPRISAAEFERNLRKTWQR